MRPNDQLLSEWPLHFISVTFSPFHSVTTVGEAPLQSIQPPWKTQMIYKCREVIMLLQIDTFSCQQKEVRHKEG